MKFDKGQELYEHIDADESESILPCGPRILTLALCLLEPAAGGETEFPELKLSKCSYDQYMLCDILTYLC